MAGYEPAAMYNATGDPAVDASVMGKRAYDQVGSMESISKRPKVDGEAFPSKVLHVRGLPQECTEQELIAVACPFGRVVNVLLMKGKNQAFIQMQDVATATALVQYYNSVRATIRGKSVYFQYSTRNEISTPSQVDVPNNILLITILNPTFPITVDVLQQVFANYQMLQKMVVFNKNGSLQALVQFGTAEVAARAKMDLDGKDIYAGCCTLRIQYSSLPILNVKYNNDKSRDFTNPSLPSDEHGNMAPSGGMGPGMGPGMANPSMFMNGMDPSMAGMYGGDPSHMQQMGMQMPGAWGGGWQNMRNPMMGNYGYSPMGGGQCVLIVNGLPEEGVTPDQLFMLFGVYGDVVRVKILFKTKEKALIQFATPQQAQTAFSHVNGLIFRDHQLRINMSKVDNINMPRAEDEEGSQLTKDFTGSPLHRYKIAGSKNFQHITSPSKVLHISNLPEVAEEDQVKALFAPYGTVVNFKFFPTNKHMALIELENVQQGVEALIALHNVLFLEQNLRVSFSKSTINNNE